MGRIYKRKKKMYTDLSVAAAVAEVRKGKSMKRIAKDFYI